MLRFNSVERVWNGRWKVQWCGEGSVERGNKVCRWKGAVVKG